VVDLEKMAVRRDKGYLVRLVLLLALGIGGGAYIYGHLTSDRTSGCMADAFVGGDAPADKE
jgi:hypothetical protein